MQDVRQLIAPIDGAVAGEEEEVERQQWLLARGHDAVAEAAADNAELQAAELAVLTGEPDSNALLYQVQQRVLFRAQQHARLLEEWMALLQARAPAGD